MHERLMDSDFGYLYRISRSKSADIDLNTFLNMSKRSQEIFYVLLNILHGDDCCFKTASFVLSFISDCESEIEKMLWMSLFIVSEAKGDNHASIITTAIYPQIETCTKEKYRADFLFCSEDLNHLDVKYEPYELVIECDGHNYHSSKEQIKKGNERDLALKMSGYDVLHFSGSQIYNKPFETAESILNYIKSKLKEEGGS